MYMEIKQYIILIKQYIFLINVYSYIYILVKNQLTIQQQQPDFVHTILLHIYFAKTII